VGGLTLDAGALIAYERADPDVLEVLRVAFRRGVTPTVPAVVLAEVWRGDRKDVRLAWLLKACTVEPLDEDRARSAGKLRRSIAGAGAIDACVAVGVRERGDAIATSDPGDMRRLVGPDIRIIRV
jgi:predicted nucleic acid-binding protein